MKSKEYTILQSLIKLDTDINEIKNKLSKLTWDSDNEIFILTKDDIFNILHKFSKKEINASELELWANLIEGREDIGKEEEHKDFIDKVIFDLANPVLSFADGEINEFYVNKILSKK